MNNQSNQSSGILKVIGIIVLVLAASVGAWYFLMYKPEQEAKEKARQEQIAKAQAEKQRQEQEAQKKARYETLIQDADAAVEQEDWESAQSLYTEASSLFPTEQYPQDQLVLVNAKLDEQAALEARKVAGIIETISAPTGRFYVIVSSSVDGDLAMDYAKELSQEGNNVKIIEPGTVNKLFHRVSIDDYDTWDQASSAIQSFSTYGSEIWVLKY